MSNFKAFLENLKSGFKSPESLLEGSFTMDNIQAVAQALAQISSQEIEPLLDRIFIDTATGSDLTRRAMEYAMSRKPSSNAKGMVKISGTAGVTVPKGLLVASDTLTFSVSSSGMIPSTGNIELPAVCTAAGALGNIAANNIQFIINSPVGLVKVTNLLAFEGGTNEETDEDFRARILEKIKMPLTGGNSNDYIYWAKQVSGIGRAKCFPLWNGNGTVKV
ncbi:MAG: baseplate J/gp47 family protein, partial [Oscillospiraceae bacterium]